MKFYIRGGNTTSLAEAISTGYTRFFAPSNEVQGWKLFASEEGLTIDVKETSNDDVMVVLTKEQSPEEQANSIRSRYYS